MQNPKRLTVKDVLEIIYSDTWVQLFDDDICRVVEEGYAEEMLRGGTRWGNFRILDIEGRSIADTACKDPYTHCIMTNFCE